MFDWISDAIDWIGDGISSLWDNTIGSAVDTITDAIWDVMFEWLFNLIYGAVADLFEFINASTSSIFALSWVQSFIALFHSLAWMLFVCGLIVAVFDTAIAYESGQANIKNTCLNVLKGFMAASLVTVVPQRLYSFCVNLQGTFSSDLLGNFISGTTTTVADSGLTVIMALAMDVSLFSLFFIILFGYCTVKVVFSNIKRGGIMLCQIAVGSLYLFGVPRGYTDGFYSWCNIDVKIHHLMMLLSTIPDFEILALDSCECFDTNKMYVKKRLQTEQNEAVRKLLQADYDFLDEIQVEMSSARQFMFAVRFRREKDEQIFSTLNRVDKAISEHGFTARRMSKSDIKRMLALYFGTSISGEEIPDIEGENEFNLEGLHEN